MAKAKETSTYKEREASLQERVPTEAEFLNPVSGARRLFRVEQVAKQAAHKAKREKEASDQALKAAQDRERAMAVQQMHTQNEEDFPYPQHYGGGVVRGSGGNRQRGWNRDPRTQN